MAKSARKSANPEPKATMPAFVQGDDDAALAAAGAEAATLHMVPVDSLEVMPGLNIRFTGSAKYEEAVERYRKSIESEGYYQSKPMTGIAGKKDGRDVVFVTDGHRRLAAVKRAVANGAEVPSVPVVLKPPGTTMIDLTAALHKENTGEPNSMAESAVIVRRFLREGMTEAEIAARLDFSDRYIQDCQVLIAAPPGVRELVKRDRVTGTTAVALLRKFKLDPAKAEAEMVRMAEKAEARALAAGKSPEEAKQARATFKDSSTGTKTGRVAVVPGDDADEDLDAPAGKLRSAVRTIKTGWSGDIGHRFELQEVKAFSRLFGDTAWYEADPDGRHATLTEPVEFKATILRAAEVAAKPPRKLSKRAQAARDAAMEAEEADDPDAPVPGIDVTAGDPDQLAAMAAEGADAEL